MKTIIYRFIVLIILFSCYKINTFGNDQTDYSENINSNNSLSLTEKSEKYFNLARVEYGNEKEVKFLHLALHYAQRDGNIDSQATIYKNLIINFYKRNQTDSVLYWGEEAKVFHRQYNMYDLYFDGW